MDRAELQSIQGPLKEQYRERPETATVTLAAEGAIEEQSLSCSVATGRALVEAGLHPASGGTGTLVCSGDMLLQALVACAGVTLKAVATSLEIPVEGSIRAEGELDFRGTLGVAKEEGVPVGFRAIKLRFDLRGEATEEQRATLLRVTERYCVVLQTLVNGVPVEASLGVTGRERMPEGFPGGARA